MLMFFFVFSGFFHSVAHIALALTLDVFESARVQLRRVIALAACCYGLMECVCVMVVLLLLLPLALCVEFLLSFILLYYFFSRSVCVLYSVVGQCNASVLC